MAFHPPVQLTAELVEAFAGIYLSPRYDQPVATPEFHRECWADYVSKEEEVLVVAPREHAKSTGLTFVFGLAEVCFRISDYVIVISSTEDMAAEQLSNLKEELGENEDLRRDFDIAAFESETKTDIIVRCGDGHRFRILARGAEQKIRGKMWKGKRPNLMICDDMEDDEQVESKDRREKFRRWFFRAARQALSRSGRIRVHGTILNEDSLLARLLTNKGWKHRFYKAHTAFDDFSDILWPENWPEERLRKRQQEFIEEGDPDGYAQEFLNDPTDNSVVFLRKGDFIPMTLEDYERPKTKLVGVDLAISKKDKANRTSFTVGGKDETNLIHVIDQYTGRWAAEEIVEQFFVIAKRHDPVGFYVEDGQIWKAISGTVHREMQVRDLWMNIIPVKPITDKKARAAPYQKHHRSGGMRFDKIADWYPGFENENIKFTGLAGAKLDDQFDSAALMVKGFELLPPVEAEDFEPEEEMDMRRKDPRLQAGRSAVTGW